MDSPTTLLSKFKDEAFRAEIVDMRFIPPRLRIRVYLNSMTVYEQSVIASNPPYNRNWKNLGQLPDGTKLQDIAETRRLEGWKIVF